MDFENLIKLNNLYLQCPECGYSIKVKWNELKNYIDKNCKKCGNCVIFTKSENKKIQEFTYDVLYGDLSSFFDLSPNGKFIINKYGKMDILINDEQFLDDESK